MKKKLMSILTATAMTLSAIPYMVSAETTEIPKSTAVSIDSNTTNEFTIENGAVTFNFSTDVVWVSTQDNFDDKYELVADIQTYTFIPETNGKYYIGVGTMGDKEEITLRNYSIENLDGNVKVVNDNNLELSANDSAKFYTSSDNYTNSNNFLKQDYYFQYFRIYGDNSSFYPRLIANEKYTEKETVNVDKEHFFYIKSMETEMNSVKLRTYCIDGYWLLYEQLEEYKPEYQNGNGKIVFERDDSFIIYSIDIADNHIVPSTIEIKETEDLNSITDIITTTTTTVTTTTITTTTTTGELSKVKGDTNLDGKLDLSDAVLVMQSLANPEKYGLNGTNPVHMTEQGKINGDIDKNGLTNADALEIQKYILRIHDSKYFQVNVNVIVTEITDESIIVTPVADSPELKSSDKFIVPLTAISDGTTPKVDSEYSIKYDGAIMETYPAQFVEIFDMRIVG